MNKKLLALAVGGVLAAPMAQAQTANVTLYGRVNLDMEVVSSRYQTVNAAGGVTSSTKPNLYRVSSNSSRLGVRGTESLGGGLNAIFQIESNVSTDSGATGNTALGNRETFVGLQGSWGTVKIGNFLAPYDDMHPIFGNAPTLTTSILSTASLWAQGTVTKAAGGFDARLQNSVRYDMPNIAGFTAGIQYASGEGSNAASNPPTTAPSGFGNGASFSASGKSNAGVWSMAGQYNAGPLQAGIAYEANQGVRACVPTLTPTTGAVCPNDWAFTATIAWNFGIVRPAFVYERLDYDVPLANGQRNDLTRDLYGLSATIPLGAGIAYASWIRANDGGGSAATGTQIGQLVKGSETGSDQWTISYSYPLSKRTLTYVGYVYTDNDRFARYNFNINPYSAPNGVGTGSGGALACVAATSNQASCGKPQGFVMGMVHFF